MPEQDRRSHDTADVGRLLQEFARNFLADEAADRNGAPLDAQRVVELAKQAVPHAVDVSLTLVRGSQPPATIAAGGDIAARVDAIEYETGEGPCLDAIEQDDIVRTDDLLRDTRWPKFSERTARETNIRSMFGVRVFLDADARGALNFYAPEPDAFSDLDTGLGAVFSTLTALVLRAVHEQRRSENLEHALESSRHIGMAMGILMSSKLLTAEQAFDQLRDASQHLHRKLRDVAADVTETGVLPGYPPGDPAAG